jgi:DNA-binding SARP family transcriptional activator
MVMNLCGDNRMLSISREGEVTQLASAAPVVFIVERAAHEGRRRGEIGQPGPVAREARKCAAEFGVLGAFAIRGADGQAVAVGGAKRRGVAALLAVRAGSPCSLDFLVEALWGDARPAGAAATVRTYMSQLRRRFGLPIETTPAGYTLAVPRESVDALRFEHLVEAARRGDDIARSVTLLSDALALWRGEPLAEFAGLPWADEHARSWERLRREAVQERVRMRLASGAHASVIAELERVVEEYPLDEQLTAYLMLARYRTGRQADALREYASLRRRLADELGIDPSAELTELERRILDHDPTLDWFEVSCATRERQTRSWSAHLGVSARFS